MLFASLKPFTLNQTVTTGFTFIDKPRPEEWGGVAAALEEGHQNYHNIHPCNSLLNISFKISGTTPQSPHPYSCYLLHLEGLSFVEHINFPTHICGHILDLVYSAGFSPPSTPISLTTWQLLWTLTFLALS